MKILVISFSGGRTSAFMCQWILTSPAYKDFEKIFIFANTGKEHESTLEFVDKCDKEMGLNLIWVEAVVNSDKGVGTTHRIVDFDSASRNGEPFENVIRKYTLPNKKWSHCTRELKQRPIRSYLRDLGVKEYWTAIGIRYDERHRAKPSAQKEKIIYPLIEDIKCDSGFIRDYWDRQPYDLQLKDYEGNCDLCFKKSLRKRLTLTKENPSIADWWRRMEEEYGTFEAPRFDMRENLSVEEIIDKSTRPFNTVQDQHELKKQQKGIFDPVWDEEYECMCKTNLN